MVLRAAKRGERAGKRFYGRSKYPSCRGIVNAEQAPPTKRLKKESIYNVFRTMIFLKLSPMRRSNANSRTRLAALSKAPSYR